MRTNIIGLSCHQVRINDARLQTRSVLIILLSSAEFNCLIVFIAEFFPWHRTSSVPICAPNFVLSIWTKIGSEPEKVCSQLESKIAGFPRPTVWTKVSVTYSILLLIKQLKKRWLCSKQMNRTGTGAHLVGNFALLLFHSELWFSRAQHNILLNVK